MIGGDLLTGIVAVLGAIAALFFYGKKRESDGKSKARDEVTREIMEADHETREAIRDALERSSGRDPDAIRRKLRERLERRDRSGDL